MQDIEERKINRDLAQKTAPRHYAQSGDQWLVGDFCRRAGLGMDEGCAVKYVCRHKDKEGAVDLLKAVEYIAHVLRLDYDIKIKVEREDEEPGAVA